MGTGRETHAGGHHGDHHYQGYLEVKIISVKDLRVPNHGPIDHHIIMKY
jgi:hypothetical protein